MSIPVILDTDIGDDIDDVLALAVILNSPEFELRGVTTVFVDALRRAHLARKMLTVWQRDSVPVAAGVSEPLLQKYAPQVCHQFGVMSDEEMQGTFPHAIDFLAAAADWELDEKLTIIAIGPLTNIALALARRPELAAKARLVMMGGQGMHGTYPEWNIKHDPEAAAMVFRSGIEISQVGFDITTQVQLTDEHLQQLAGQDNQRMRFVSELVERWRNGQSYYPYLHDPLAVLTLLTDVVELQPVQMDMSLCPPARGNIIFAEQTEAVHSVAVSVDAPRAIDFFMARLLAE